MARVETIVVGGGIGAGTPFQLNFVPIVGSVDPPLLITTDFMFTVPTGATRGLIVGTSDPDATATEKLRVLGGILSEHSSIAESVSLGQRQTVTGTFTSGPLLVGRDLTISTSSNSANEPVLVGVDISIVSGGALSSVVAVGSNISANAASYQGILIGRTITTTAPGGNEILIGHNITSGTGQSNIAIGDSITLSGTGGNNTLIGHTAAKSSGVGQAVVIGFAAGAGSGGTSCIVIGESAQASALECIVIGRACTATHANNILIGRTLTSFAVQTCMIGGPTAAPILTVVIGGQSDTVNGNGSNLTIRQTNCTGTDRVGGILTLQSGLGTGAGAVSSVRIATPTVLGSGTTAQTATERLRIDSGLGVAANTGMMLWDVDNATLERVTVGAADSGGAGFKLLRIPN